MKKVIIVGGGVAGLTAGKRLVDSGKFSVKLLEGDSRVGGRVHTIPLGMLYDFRFYACMYYLEFGFIVLTVVYADIFCLLINYFFAIV